MLTNHALCDMCSKNIPLHRTLFCGNCSSRFAENKKICHKSFPYVLGASATYENRCIKALITSLKFDGNTQSGQFLGALITAYSKYLPPKYFKNSVIIPIPLSKQRMRERGFNQAEIIASNLANHYRLTINTSALRRTKKTKAQTLLSSIKERAENVSGCFEVVEFSEVYRKKIILIDDVTTSGETLLSAAQELKKHDCGNILALVAAKT